MKHYMKHYLKDWKFYVFAFLSRYGCSCHLIQMSKDTPVPVRGHYLQTQGKASEAN